MKTPEHRTSISFSGNSKKLFDAYENLPSPPQSKFSSSSSLSIASSSSSSLSVPPRLSQVGQIRCRLLYRLGIDPKQPNQKYTKPALSKEYNTARTKSIPEPFVQPLRDNVSSFGTAPALAPESFNHHYDNNDNSDTKFRNYTIGKIHRKYNRSNDEGSASPPPDRRTVHFDNNVLVVPIPSRHDYSNRIKKALWRNKNEIRDIVDRNRYEYLSEGWEWSRVLEDEEMYFDVATGDKIHPCWVDGVEGDGHGCTDSFDGNRAKLQSI